VRVCVCVYALMRVHVLVSAQGAVWEALFGRYELTDADMRALDDDDTHMAYDDVTLAAAQTMLSVRDAFAGCAVSLHRDAYELLRAEQGCVWRTGRRAAARVHDARVKAAALSVLRAAGVVVPAAAADEGGHSQHMCVRVLVCLSGLLYALPSNNDDDDDIDHDDKASSTHAQQQQQQQQRQRADDDSAKAPLLQAAPFDIREVRVRVSVSVSDMSYM
jgi:hypothetical protein